MKIATAGAGGRNSLPDQIARLWKALPRRGRTQFCLLIFFIVAVSFAELFSIGAVLPSLAVLSDPQFVFNQRHAQPIIFLLGIIARQQFLLPLTIIFAEVASVAGAMRLMLLYLSTRLSFAAGAGLSIKTCRRILYQPNSVHIVRNSSQIISGLTGKTTTVIYAVLMPLVNLVGSLLFLLCLIMAALAAVALGKKFKSIGYDLSETKVNAYRQFTDLTGEVSPEELRAATQFECTADQRRLASADFLIVGVPALVDEAHIPDFTPLVMANTTAGAFS